MTAPPLSFLIVGSPRSGTTLMQRLACELPDVGMPPETHFLDYVVPELLRRGPGDVRQTLTDWLNRPQLRGIEVNVDTLLTAVGERCSSAGSLFAEVVRQLSPQHGTRGEKTPSHVSWWRPLSTFAPNLRFVAVVRDPRAVVASNLAVPWATDVADPPGRRDDHCLALAERWRSQQMDVLRMVREIPERCSVFHYEHVTADPIAASRLLASALGVDHATKRPVAASQQIIMPWETWKASALGPITTDRNDAWRDELEPVSAATVAAICAAPMRALGYAAPGPAAAAARIARLPPHRIRSLRGLRKGLAARRRWIESVVL